MGVFRWLAPVFGRYGDRWDDDLLGRVEGWLKPYVRERRTLLDVGGGTGALAAHLVDALDVDATVLDATPEMIAQARPHPRLTAVLGRAEAMPFADAVFDACVVTDAFHHFSDQDGAAREIARVVRPGGGVLVLDFEPRGCLRPIAGLELLLGEPGIFYAPDEMCAFMSRFGVDGRCERLSRSAYYFLGTVGGPSSPPD